MRQKPAVILIMDGFGLNPKHEANAVYMAKTPNLEKILRHTHSRRAMRQALT